MVSRKNTVVIACIAAAMVLYLVLIVQELVVEDWLAFAALLGVGVVLPQLLNGYFDSEFALDTTE